MEMPFVANVITIAGDVCSRSPEHLEKKTRQEGKKGSVGERKSGKSKGVGRQSW